MKDRSAARARGKSDRSRNRLFVMAKGLFAEKGYDGVTVEQICQKAGLSKNVFYSCFSSKLDILAMQIREIDEEQMKLFETLPKDASCVERLLKFMEFQATYVERCGMETFRTLYREELSPRARRRYLTDETRPLYAKTGQLVKEGQAAGELRQDTDAGEVTAMLVTGLRGVTLSWILSDGRTDLIQTSLRMVSSLLEGLRSGEQIPLAEK